MTKTISHSTVYQPESGISTIQELTSQCEKVGYFYSISDTAKAKLLLLFNEFNSEIRKGLFTTAPYISSYLYQNNVSENNKRNSLGFKKQISKWIENDTIPEEIIELGRKLKSKRKEGESTFYIDNIVVDEKPVAMSFETPTQDKYKKDSFINEMMIELLTQLSGGISIGYQQRSNGDIPQDVIPTRGLANMQTQRNMMPFKKNKALGKHQDRAYANPKPEGVILDGLHTAGKENIVLTTICELKEFKEYLSESTIRVLSIPMFTIVPDEFTRKTTKIENEKVGPILHEDGISMTYYTGRVIWNEAIRQKYGYSDQDIQTALEDLEAGMSKVMKYVDMKQGDSLKISNTQAVHGKLANIKDPKTAMQRYLLKQYLLSQKTFNTASANGLILPGTHIVKETAK